MAIYRVQTPDGKIIRVEGPEGASEAEVIAQAQQLVAQPSTLDKVLETGKNVLGFAGETAKNAFKGAMGGAETALQGHPILGPLLNFAGIQMGGKTPAQAIKDLPAEDLGLWGKIAQGAGGALLGAPSAATIPVAAAAGAMGALGGEAAGNFAEKSGLPRPVGEIPGALAAGGATGFLLGPRQTPAQQDIRKALEGISTNDWLTAAGKVNDFNAVGSKTATLGEAFPKNSPIQDLTAMARGGNLNNAVKQRTIGRAEDLQALGQNYLDRIGPPVNANAVANRVSSAAESLRQNLANLKNEGFRNRVGDEAIRPDKVRALYDALLGAADSSTRVPEANAYRAIAQELLSNQTGPDGKRLLLTKTADLSKALHRLDGMMKDPSGLNMGGANIAANDLRIPLRNAKEGLGEISPTFAEALDDARTFNKNIREPFAESPLNALADRNPNNIYPTPASRLNKITSGTDENQVTAIAQALSQGPGLRPGQGVSPLEIARAMGQEALKGGPTDPGAAVRGAAGSSREVQIAALLAAGGQNPARTMLPLNIADDLQGAMGPGGVKEMPRMTFVQGLLRPFRTADMAITRQGMQGIEKEIADLLANPTIANLNRLREIAMFDPNVRRQLSTMAPLLGTIGAAEEN